MKLEDSLILMALLFVLFAVVHSVTASARFKQKIVNRLREKFAFYRLAYNLLSLIMFVPVVLIRPVSDPILYTVDGWLFYLFVALRVCAVGLFLWTLRDFDGLEFMGLRQVRRFYRGEYDFEAEAESAEAFELNTGGMFAVCRHPLYLFAILALVFETSVSVWYAGFATLLILYFVTGAYFEERRMSSFLGEVYERYKREVPAFIPYRVLIQKRVNRPEKSVENRGN